MQTDWTKILAMRFVQVSVSILMIALIITAITGLATNKAINMWGLTFNTKETVFIHDTLTLYKTNHDTITITKIEYTPRSREGISTSDRPNFSVTSNGQTGGTTAGQIMDSHK